MNSRLVLTADALLQQEGFFIIVVLYNFNVSIMLTNFLLELCKHSLVTC